MVNHAILHMVDSAFGFCLCSRTLQMEPFSDAQSKTNNPVCLVDVNSSLIVPAKAQRYRVEALRKTIASLDARVNYETVRLGITGPKESLTRTKPTGDKHEDRKKRKKKKKNESLFINENVSKKEIKISEGKLLTWSMTDKKGTIHLNKTKMREVSEFLNAYCR